VSETTLIGWLLGAPIAIDILVMIIFGGWAAWYTITRRPHRAPVLWWRDRAPERDGHHSPQSRQQRRVANWNAHR
jgi:hypothetical protein